MFLKKNVWLQQIPSNRCHFLGLGNLRVVHSICRTEQVTTGGGKKEDEMSESMIIPGLPFGVG
jgi:hypothetical protein